jgi:iron complex outermembrane recepter protein
MKRFLLASSAVLFSVSASPLLAQEAQTADDEAQPGDIIVTATRSETLLSKTPIAITAITGEGLRDAGITGPTDLGNSVPNLSIDRVGNAVQITIRGVSSTDNTEKGDPSAAFLLDGVYLARPQQVDVAFFDINRVEVLRGPQGTLYGRNTTAGVVNVITNKPKLGEFGAGVNAGYGSYNAFNVDGFVNVPLGDKLALRVAASYDERDNYIRPAVGDNVKLDPFRKNFSSRAQLYFEPSDAINITLRGEYSTLKGSRVSDVRASNFYDLGTLDALGRPVWTAGNRSTRQLLTRTTDIQPVPAPTFGIGDPGTTEPSIDNNIWGVEGEFNWDLGGVGLTYIGSYREYHANENLGFDVGAPITFGATFNGDYEQQSHEFRVALSGDGPLKAQTGLYYFREESAIALILLNTPFSCRDRAIPGDNTSACLAFYPVFGFPQAPTIASSKAAYAQATYSLSDSLRFTLGGRYTDDNKSRFGNTILQNTLTFNPANGTDRNFLNAAAIDGNIKNKKFTWLARAEADVFGSGLLYASVSTGYKAGGFGDGCLAGTTTRGRLCNQARDPRILFYQPETLTAYEIGFKNRFGDALRVSVAAFHYEYKNLQLSQIANVSGAPSTVTLNAGAAKVTGVEAEAAITPSENDRIDLSYSYTDARYATYCPFDDPTSTLAIGANGCRTALSFEGRPLDRSPKHVASASYAHTFPVGEGDVVARVGTRLSSSYVITNFGAGVQYLNPSNTRTDVSLTYNAPNDRFYVSGYVQNLENSVRLQRVDGFANASPSDPRTYGVRAGFKF